MLAIGLYDHYALFSKLARQLNCSWQHLDAFYVRETSQAELRTHVLRQPSGSWSIENLNAFGTAQISLTVEIINAIKPEMLVVANAGAAAILCDAMGITFDDLYGHHSASVSGQIVPTFLSSQWTGSAMDRYSRQRLWWQIARIHALGRQSR